MFLLANVGGAVFFFFFIIVFVVTLQNPNDIAYVFSGYAPLTVRLAQFLARPQGWRGLEEVITDDSGFE